MLVYIPSYNSFIPIFQFVFQVNVHPDITFIVSAGGESLSSSMTTTELSASMTTTELSASMTTTELSASMTTTELRKSLRAPNKVKYNEEKEELLRDIAAKDAELVQCLYYFHVINSQISSNSILVCVFGWGRRGHLCYFPVTHA